MMIGKSVPEYIFVMTAIVGLQLVLPLSTLYVVWTLFAENSILHSKWLHVCLLVYASLEVIFFACVYLPRRYHLQRAADHPVMSREQRRTLFQRCAAYTIITPGSGDTSNYPSGWFFRKYAFCRDNVLEWLLWALFSTPMPALSAITADRAALRPWEAETSEYIAMAEKIIGRTLPEGYNVDTPCMRLTLDPVRMVHRPLLWYLIVGSVDVVTCVRLYWLGFRHYTDKRIFQSFPFRPLTLFSRASSVQGFSYWYRPHRALEEHPVLFLHGIGIGLYPYTGFLADLALRHPDIGIIVPEFLSISSRITSAPLSRTATARALEAILDAHAHPQIILAAHSYGTVITSHLFHTPSFTPRIAATLLVDPIPFLLHLPDVAFNFVYRAPNSANEWLLWYFSSRDPDVARTLARHFFWAENVLWREELEGKRVAVMLSGRDQVVNAEAVRRYLTGQDEGNEYWHGRVGEQGMLEVMFYPELDHAMVFNTRSRWRRLMPVLDRFIRVLD